jgi:hypothetical protein
VHLDGTAAAVRDPPHRDAVGSPGFGVAAQRVLAHQSAGQVNIDVGTRMPARQVLADQRQRDDVLIVGDHPSVGHRQRDVSVGFVGHPDPPGGPGQRLHPRDHRARDTDQHVAAPRRNGFDGSSR